MADTNDRPESSLTQPTEPVEEETKATDSTAEGETPPAPKAETEPPTGTKSWEHALQLAREREKKASAQRAETEERLNAALKQLEEYQLQGLGETERERVAREKAEARVAQLEQQLQIEDTIKGYRRTFAEKAAEFPKTAEFIMRQMDKGIYPVQGATQEELEDNFISFAQDYEGKTQEQAKPTVSNPVYTPPAEVDLNKLSSEEMSKILPHKEQE